MGGPQTGFVVFRRWSISIPKVQFRSRKSVLQSPPFDTYLFPRDLWARLDPGNGPNRAMFPANGAVEGPLPRSTGCISETEYPLPAEVAVGQRSSAVVVM